MHQKKLEQFLREKILPDLENGRPNDKPHTLDVVNQIKKIINNSPELILDEDALVIAAYAHDWGYTDLFKAINAPLTMDHLRAEKDNHMQIGSQKLAKLLEDRFFGFLSSDQKRRAIHLVAVHDKIKTLQDTDELILLEADSLAGMNVNIMGIFREPASEERFMRKAVEFRLSRFITDYSKQEFERLYKKRRGVYK